MSIIVEWIPFELNQKVISFNDFFLKSIDYLQDQDDMKTIEYDMENDDWIRYSLSDIRKLYAA